MASYTVKTSKKEETGLQFSYDTYANKQKFPTQAEYLDHMVSKQTTGPMYQDYLYQTSVALDKSIATIPEANLPAAQDEIEAVIVAHGGTLVPPGYQPVPPVGVAAGTEPGEDQPE